MPASARVALIRECSRSPRRLLRRADPAAAARVLPDARGPHHHHQPFDKSSMHAIEKAIQQADLGVNPPMTATSSGVSCLRLPRSGARSTSRWPSTRPRRPRVSVRNIRRHAKEAIEKFVKDGEVGEDDGTGGEKDRAVDQEFVDQVDDLVKHKEAELLRGLSVEPGPETTTSDQPSDVVVDPTGPADDAPVDSRGRRPQEVPGRTGPTGGDRGGRRPGRARARPTAHSARSSSLPARRGDLPGCLGDASSAAVCPINAPIVPILLGRSACSWPPTCAGPRRWPSPSA